MKIAFENVPSRLVSIELKMPTYLLIVQSCLFPDFFLKQKKKEGHHHFEGKVHFF